MSITYKYRNWFVKSDVQKSYGEVKADCCHVLGLFWATYRLALYSRRQITIKRNTSSREKNLEERGNMNITFVKYVHSIR